LINDKNIKLTWSQEKQLGIAMKHIKDGKPVCFYGEAGVGKTMMAYVIADRLGANVQEFNASSERTKNDIARIMRLIRMDSMSKKLFLFDEVDSFRNWKALRKILIMRRHDVIMTANDAWKLPEDLKKNKKINLVLVRVYAPKQAEVSEVLQNQGFSSGFGVINADFRDSKNAMVSGGKTHKDVIIFDKIKRMMTRSHEVTPEIVEKERYKFFSLMRSGNKGFCTINKDSYLIWLHDNITKFYTGRDVFDALLKIANADLMYKPELLAFMPRGRGGIVKHPYFLKQLKIHGKWQSKAS